MRVADILTAERVRLDVDATSKKRVLEEVAEIMADAHASLSTRAVFDCLVARERLGTTGLGHGVALPHGRLRGLTDTIASFLKMRTGIDFDAPDGQPVDMVFALLVPEESTEEHLQILARIAEFFDSASSREALRSSDSAVQACELLCEANDEG